MTQSAGPIGNETCAVVVTYNPDPVDVAALLERITPQVGRVVLIDNGSRSDLCMQVKAIAEKFERVEAMPLEHNLGVAAGQNIGIRDALRRGFQFVLLLDHDSLPAVDMTPRLLAAFNDLASGGIRVAAVGAQYVQRQSGVRSFFVQLGPLGFRRIYCTGSADKVRADFLISSGCLISGDALRDVGLMREDFFIDQVDTEWFLRAAKKGWALYGVCNATMEHALGDDTIRVWLGRWRHVATHSPLRHYYSFRNSLYLYTRSDFPWRWKFSDAMRLAGVLLVFGTCAHDRGSHLKMMLAGVWDGLRGRLGKFENPRARTADG